jgi:hypothetical protein
MVRAPFIRSSDTPMPCYLVQLIQCSRLFGFAALRPLDLHLLQFPQHLCAPHHYACSKSSLPEIIQDEASMFARSNALNTPPSFSSACLGIALDDSGPGRQPHPDHLPPDQAMNAFADYSTE